MRIGIWQVEGDRPKRIEPGAIDLEKHLEDWIEQDPALLESGLTIVARQLMTDVGPLDLLARNPQGEWVIVELKRDLLRREAVAQALDYAASMATWDSETLKQKIVSNRQQHPSLGNSGTTLEELNIDWEQRDMRIFIVGLRVEPALLRLVQYLGSRLSIPISIISFEAYELAGQRVLIREVGEAEGALPPTSAATPSVGDLVHLAESKGVGTPFAAVLTSAQSLNLYPRPFKESLMFAPQANRTKSLFTMWTYPDKNGALLVWLGFDSFKQYFALDEETLVSAFGSMSGYLHLDSGSLGSFLNGLESLRPYLAPEEQA